MDGRVVGAVLALAGLLFTFVGVTFLKVLLAILGLFLGGWVFLQAVRASSSCRYDGMRVPVRPASSPRV